ncbi:NADH dehydrogenase (ubiquinone) 1 beta subcomplex subunit 3 [Schistosoma bovis]|uniref:NADH dehydrogenase (Ubiquinone) 1 beta subcomplex subunit 3 n=2 Tax=Schistosoma TaxID=6181 RepID=A0A430QRG7_SCHBO|nr:NADH dehydrogenase (ubiquinone) 1 beta subcomplex subunit 3 [Schistosoma bovis]
MARRLDMKINWKCPDWKTYTLDPPPLKEHVEKLAKLGLKDPWARNYAWQYLPKIYKPRSQRFREILLARLPHGVALGIVASILINQFDRWRKGEFSAAKH